MQHLLSIFKALSDQSRLRIFVALMTNEELCACQITELLQVTGATVSRHMGILISSKLLKSRKEGRWVYYSLNKERTAFTSALWWIERDLQNDPVILSDIERLAEITSCDPSELCRKQSCS